MRTNCIVTLTFILACTPKGEGSTDDATMDPSTGETPGDSSTTGAPTTGADTTTGADATTGPEATTDAGTSGAAEDPACAALCAHEVECDVPFSDSCLQDCASQRQIHGYPGEACLALQDAIHACQTAATCEALTDPEASPCQAQHDALISDACTVEVCDQYAARLLECDLIDADWQLSRAYECTTNLGGRLEFGEACVVASEALMACVVGLTCEQFESGEGCEAEEQAADDACL